MTRQLICIVCPAGCEMTACIKDGKLEVWGEKCKRGLEYAEREFTNPMRTIATSVLVDNGELPLAPVRLDNPVPKKQIFNIMREIKAVRLEAPVHIGQIVLSDVCGCGSDVVVTKNVGRAQPRL